MKQALLCLALLALLLPAFAQLTIPRVYVQKLILKNGKLPTVTSTKEKSAEEYIVNTWILERPEEVLSTETHGVHHVKLAKIGDNDRFPATAVCQVNLGNFPSQWKEGENLHLQVIHKKTGQIAEWDVYIPAGTALIKMLDTPQVIPPYGKVKAKTK